MRKIGITGGVGTGKSTILQYMQKKYDAKIIYADEVAHLLEAKGQPCYNKLVELLGKDILLDDGEINKKEMASRIFSDSGLLDRVNAIIHPMVNSYIFGCIEKYEHEGVKLFVLEAALLIENGYKNILDEIWYICTDDEVRRKRLKETRGYSDSKIDSIFKGQMNAGEYAANCDSVIYNNGDVNEAFAAIDKLLGEF